ncbi:BPSL0067 family protein [Sphingomonas bacterium]|uniref:BPSL0067 family protein n=1 Tax=Sphingomonas bacterium TaxID=1895847 RepID=UPI001576ED2F|nr:BPSL0067 family protein [Sphingomonas bacterium]
MAYVSANYRNNTAAPFGQWVCNRISPLGPYAAKPEAKLQHGPVNFCGQCVSFVTQVCPSIPVSTAQWKKGVQVKGATLAAGTAIATFDANGHYYGHAAIYENQNASGINVVDQWVTGAGSPIHARLIRFGGHGLANDGNGFYVID